MDAGTASIIFTGISGPVTAFKASPVDPNLVVTTDKDGWIKVRSRTYNLTPKFSPATLYV